MMRASSSTLGSKAHCSPSAAIGGVWAFGGAANLGKRKQVRYAAVHSGAFADAQMVGHSLRVHARVQLSIQPDGYSAARFRRRLIQRYAGNR
jgi:hypothetical protein